MTFEEFVAERDAARAERDRVRVTWRRAHWYESLRGDLVRVNGYSGLGSEGRLVYVRFNERANRDEVYTGEWEYGRVDVHSWRGVESVGETQARRIRAGATRTFTSAKTRAEALLR